MSDTQVTNPAPVQERVFRRTPELEIVEDEQALFVSADLPGVAAGDVEVALDDGVLTVRGRARQGTNGSTVITEFVRQLTLSDPSRYDGEQIGAVLSHGVLELRIPKHERAKRRQIPITVN